MILVIFRHRRIWMLILASILMIVVGTFLFAYLEQLTLVDAFYFTVSTMTTVGYGDVVMTHDLAKLLASAYMIASIPLLLIAIEFTVEVLYDDYHHARLEKKHTSRS